MILVTGGTGLTGSHLLFELVSHGNTVKATKREGSSVEFVKKVFSIYSSNVDELYKRIEWVDANLLDYRALVDATESVDLVYHTGAIVSFNSKDASKIKETNIRGTANIVDACIQNRVKTLCHVSSIASLGEPNEQGFVDESCIWSKSKGKSAYAKSKFYGEMEVWRGAEQGLRVIVVNPSVILGSGRWDSGSGQLISRISKGMSFYTNGITGYVDVRDVVKAMILLCNNPNIKNERFVLNSQNLSFKDIFSMIAERAGKKPPSIELKPWLVNLAFPFLKIMGLLLGSKTSISKENLNSAYSKTFYSSEKFLALTGYTFIPIADSIKFIEEIYKSDNL